MKKPRPPRLHGSGNQQPLVTGVAWYTSSEWARVKATAVDPERFEVSFEEWVAMAEKALADIRKAGVAAQKCLIDADEFREWCVAKGVQNNAAARAEFVSEKVRSHGHAGGA
jgi:hypothetical protein